MKHYLLQYFDGGNNPHDIVSLGTYDSEFQNVYFRAILNWVGLCYAFVLLLQRRLI